VRIGRCVAISRALKYHNPMLIVSTQRMREMQLRRGHSGIRIMTFEARCPSVDPQIAEREWMQVSNTARGKLREWRRAIRCLCIFVSIFVVSVFGVQTHAQDIAEAARQEKARKAAEQNSSKHVYTQDDLKRQVILTPEDPYKQQHKGVPSQQNAEQTSDPKSPQTESLGEIARRYRRAKAAREAELTSKKKFIPFPYNLPEHTLAMPKSGVAPLLPPGSILKGRANSSVPGLTPNLPSNVPRSRARLSPFQPRPLTVGPTILPDTSPSISSASQPPIEHRPSEKRDAPIAANRGTQRVTVQPGQSWWKLAELYLGSGARWPELKALNPQPTGSAGFLEARSTVVVPELAQASPASATSRQSITVQRGDSLWSLAKEHLGRGSAWSCLAVANPQVLDYMHLTIGTTLQLPEGSALDSCLNRQPSYPSHQH
jgi:LysM repeat protein